MTDPERGVPRLGLGTWKLEGELCVNRVREALAMGYRHVDTAQMYGNETEVGRAIKESKVPREEVFVTTKIWLENLSREDVVRTTEQSLRRLSSDYVDLLLIHWPNEDVPMEETLGAMVQLRERQKVRNIGVSNFTPELWERALAIAPVPYNQVEYHPFLDQEPLLQKARTHNLTLIAYSPLAQGRVAKVPTLQEIGRRHGKSAAQVGLRWLIQQEHVAAIPKAAKSEHLEANWAVLGFELSPEEMRSISALRGSERLVDPNWAPWKH